MGTARPEKLGGLVFLKVRVFQQLPWKDSNSCRPGGADQRDESHRERDRPEASEVGRVLRKVEPRRRPDDDGKIGGTMSMDNGLEYVCTVGVGAAREAPSLRYPLQGLRKRLHLSIFPFPPVL